MMRCIPEEPDFGEGQAAEHAVWQQLCGSLPDGAVLAHSVLVRHGGAEHEIDLLVLWPGVGLAAIEVKGGRVRVQEGQWQQSGGPGGWHRMKNPLAQSQSSMHAFKRSVADLGTALHSRFAYMACFPYTDVPADWAMGGCPRTLILDRSDLESPAAYIRRAIEEEGSGGSPLAPNFMERIAAYLAGDFESASDSGASERELEDQQDHLTAQQKNVLDITRSVRRAQYSGGAGSGKTWLAVEKARRLCRDGKRVGLFCYNKGLGQYLQYRTDGWRQAKPVFTGEFHEYARTLGVPDGSGTDYFDQEMPLLLQERTATLPAEEKLDAVVIDEAQDFAPLWWESLLSCLKEPGSGEVYAFMDGHQDVYRRWPGAPVDFVLNQPAALVPLHIDDNLRNTRRIAETFRSFAGDHFTPRGGTGMPVRQVSCSTEDALDLASDCLDALIDEGWANNQIALLTTHRRHPIHQDYVEHNALAEYWRQFHADDAEFYGHVLGFKGLERSVVILCVNGFKHMGRAAEQLYVGLSRARSLLVVVGDPVLLAEAGGKELERALAKAEHWDPAGLLDRQ
jgi:hypothetical protein